MWGRVVEMRVAREEALKKSPYKRLLVNGKNICISIEIFYITPKL
jgi:hypothetical protein